MQIDADYPPALVKTATHSVSTRYLIDLVRTGALDLDPPFQRRDVWSDGEQSQFVESMLLGLPIPVMCFAEEKHGRLSVVDGRQRLKAILRFADDDLRLDSLSLAPALDGLSFGGLPKSYHQRFMNTALSVVRLSEDSPPWIKPVLFLRLNSGGKPLARQEYRNARFRGLLNDALKDAAEHPFLLRQLNMPLHSHGYAVMSNVEYVLRFLAFSEPDIILEKGSSGILDGFMREKQHATPNEVERYLSRFYRSLHACERLWGEHAFKRYSSRTGWQSSPVAPIYDAEMLGCALLSDDQLEAVEQTGAAIEVTQRAFERGTLSEITRLTPISLSGARRRAELVAAMLLGITRTR